MIVNSLDPRFNRAELEIDKPHQNLKELDQWQTFEVFMQVKRGAHHIHVGSVHAPNPEMAILFGKEQFGRRGVNVNIWVTKTADIFATEYEDSDIFETIPDKQYREAGVYKVMDRIQAYKAKQPTE